MKIILLYIFSHIYYFSITVEDDLYLAKYLSTNWRNVGYPSTILDTYRKKHKAHYNKLTFDQSINKAKKEGLFLCMKQVEQHRFQPHVQIITDFISVFHLEYITLRMPGQASNNRILHISCVLLLIITTVCLYGMLILLLTNNHENFEQSSLGFANNSLIQASEYRFNKILSNRHC
uniref:Uncharacterized protein n=1 Tax=Glossina palpalis gambiensis TaxID=67801 RepID=A0A1B0AQI2_9MUSC